MTSIKTLVGQIQICDLHIVIVTLRDLEFWHGQGFFIQETASTFLRVTLKDIVDIQS